MSLRKGAPYEDKLEDDGCILIYEGHDVSRANGISDPKLFDQPMNTPQGRLTQNGYFYNAAIDAKRGLARYELVRVYEKIKNGIWTFNGIFKLADAWIQKSNNRNVFKFKLELIEEREEKRDEKAKALPHNRVIPTAVKLQVWKRDQGKCVECGSRDNLHFDHLLPFSKGGTSLKAENIQLLCARHNLEKRDKII